MDDLIIEGIVWGVHSYTSWLGRRFDDTAEFLDKTAETLRWLAVLTRVTP